MATASSSIYEENDAVEPKEKKEKISISDKFGKKAYIPPGGLPQDFLRVVLNDQQLNENNDSLLAQRLQYVGYDQVQMMQHRSRVMAATMGRGKLQIDIIEARLTKNYGFTKMDPYVRLRLGPKIFETPTDYSGGKNPKWRKTIMCYLPFNIDMLLIEIFDEKSFTDDELIAFVKYPLPNSLFDGIFLDEWIPLSGKLGELKEGHINVQMIFTPITNMNPINPVNYPNIIPIKTNSNSSSISSASSSSSTNGSTSPSNSAGQIIQPNAVHIPQEMVSSNVSNLPIYTQADLDSIKEMFPSFELDVIKSILDANRGNKEASIEALLAMSVD